ncbi:hypothetical protein [Pyxidicoccus caerfyrddinensis]|uniref:hypothetical protein n=1 Tax=Pyxidicoccus caerfyrddinensis TaxID=2709663 RepID=UPI0013DD6A98|nr:hypothetical protein [Pyxidicoccus caerfyrddinensis]
MKDYYVRFPALPLTRSDVMARLAPVFQGEEVLPSDEDCEELALEARLQMHVWTGRTAQCRGVAEALARAEDWQGVAIHFRYAVGPLHCSMSLLLWNYHRRDLTTVALYEPTDLFDLQKEHPAAWARARRLFLSMGRALEASFCQLECDPDLGTPTLYEVSGVLERILTDGAVPYFLAARPEVLPEALDAVRAGPTCRVLREQDYVVIEDARMGTPGEEQDGGAGRPW